MADGVKITVVSIQTFEVPAGTISAGDPQHFADFRMHDGDAPRPITTQRIGTYGWPQESHDQCDDVEQSLKAAGRASERREAIVNRSSVKEASEKAND